MFKVILDHAKNLPNKKKESIVSYPFWMPLNSEREIVFVSHEALAFRAHKIKVGNNWESLTCMEMVGKPCPLCELSKQLEGEYYAKKQYAFTILDRFYKDRKGNEYSNQLKLFICGEKTYQKIRRHDMKRAATGENLTGLRFNAIRGPETTSAGCGEEFEPLGAFSKEEMIALNPNANKALDYATLLAPNEEKIAQAVLVLEALLKEAKETPTVSYT